MYIRITTVTYDVAKEQEVQRVIDEQMIPFMRQLPGFNGYTGGLDRTTGRGVAITTWDDMDQAAGSQGRPRRSGRSGRSVRGARHPL